LGEKLAQEPSRKKNKRKYSKGELNCVIDGILNQLFGRIGAFKVVDTALHSLVEQNP
jgi:hypothetical protein